MADPMTARQFLESSWFKLLWRGVIVVGIPALSGVSAYAGYTLNSVYGQQASLTREVAEIKETQTDRATVNDEFQTEITTDVAAIAIKVEKIDDAMSAIQIDVARIVGIVSEMQRRDVAARYIPQQ
jgi:type II secretory pathway component PulM